MFFSDLVFLFEDEAGFSPFTYQLDVSKLSEGEHLMTIDLLSYDDHCAAVTKRVLVKNK